MASTRQLWTCNQGIIDPVHQQHTRDHLISVCRFQTPLILLVHSKLWTWSYQWRECRKYGIDSSIHGILFNRISNKGSHLNPYFYRVRGNRIDWPSVENNKFEVFLTFFLKLKATDEVMLLENIVFTFLLYPNMTMFSAILSASHDRCPMLLLCKLFLHSFHGWGLHNIDYCYYHWCPLI